MKTIIAILVILLMLVAVTPAVADTWYVTVTGTVTSVKQISDDSSVLIFTLANPGSCEITTVYAHGWLAARWNTRIRKGMILTVTGTERPDQYRVIDAVSIRR